MKTSNSLRLARLAERVALAVPIGVTRALTITLSTAIPATTLTVFSPILGVTRHPLGRRSRVCGSDWYDRCSPIMALALGCRQQVDTRVGVIEMT